MRVHPLLGAFVICVRSVDDAVRVLWGEEVTVTLESAQVWISAAAYMRDDGDSATTDAADM